MSRCDVCGNDSDEPIEVTRAGRTMAFAGRTMAFDSFECAIQALAPVCAHCGCRIVGHGVQLGGAIYCCAHCARRERGLKDRA